MHRLLKIFPVLLLATACSSKQVDEGASAPLPQSIDEAVNSKYRSEKNKERDQYRHPKETLEFFGLKPNMKVIEITPGKGWYTEIIAPYLAKDGVYIAGLMPEGDSSYIKEANQTVKTWLTNNPQVAKKTQVVEFDPTQAKPLTEAQDVDLILTFRNTHNWIKAGKAEEAFESFFKTLKPGGTLGVVQHRAIKKSKKDAKGETGYIHQDDVIKLAKKAGFKLASKSEINANPKDTRNHPEGVWTLPPVLRLKDKNQEKYLSIGESDRMTLKFVKPI